MTNQEAESVANAIISLFSRVGIPKVDYFTYRYIDDILSINNSRFAEFLPLIYPPELEVKETTDTASSHHFWTDTSNLTTVVNSVLKFMISGTTSILKS